MTFNHYKMKELISDISMGPFGSNIKTDCYQESGVPYLNGSNLMGVTLVEDKFNYISEEKANELGRAVAQRGDVIVTHRGTLGQISYIPPTSKYKRYVTGNSQFRFSCNKLLLPEYIVYYFHSRKGQHTLLSNSSRVGVPALARPTSSFQTLDVEIPDVDTQKRIVKILSSLDAKIELNNKINANLQQQAQALFKSWFVDFEPWGGVMPEGWRESTLSECTSLIAKGITPSYAEESDQIVINQKCIRNHQINLDLAKRHKPKLINDKWVSYGDILINSTGVGTLGRSAQVYFTSDKITVDSHVTIVRPCSAELIPFLGLLLIGSESLFVSMQSGSTGQTDLPRERLFNMPLILPDKDTLTDFASLVTPIINSTVVYQNENRHLAELRDTLLPKLMSGELDVSDIELSEVSDA